MNSMHQMKTGNYCVPFSNHCNPSATSDDGSAFFVSPLYDFTAVELPVNFYGRSKMIRRSQSSVKGGWLNAGYFSACAKVNISNSDILLYCMILQSLESVKLGSFKTFALLWNSSCCWDFCQISVQLENGLLETLTIWTDKVVTVCHYFILRIMIIFFCRVRNNESLALLDVY